MGAMLNSDDGDRFLVSSHELARAERELRSLHKEQNTIAATVEEHLLMVRVLAAIAHGHDNPRALAKAAITVLDRAANG